MEKHEPKLFSVIRTRKKLLESLMELTGKREGDFLVLKPQRVADLLTQKLGKKISAKKVCSLVREVFGDHCIERRASRFFITLHMDNLKKALEQYDQWRI